MDTLISTRLADGIDKVGQDFGLGWLAHRLYPRSGFAIGGRLPRSYSEFRESFRRDFTDLRRVYMANRGVWEAIYSAGPCVGIAHTENDVDRYLNVLSDLATEIAA